MQPLSLRLPQVLIKPRKISAVHWWWYFSNWNSCCRSCKTCQKLERWDFGNNFQWCLAAKLSSKTASSRRWCSLPCCSGTRWRRTRWTRLAGTWQPGRLQQKRRSSLLESSGWSRPWTSCRSLAPWRCGCPAGWIGLLRAGPCWTRRCGSCSWWWWAGLRSPRVSLNCFCVSEFVKHCTDSPPLDPELLVSSHL